MIIKLTDRPIELWFHEGISKAQPTESNYGKGTDYKHYVNGAKANEIIYLPQEAQDQLDNLAQELQNDTPIVAAMKTKRGNRNEYHLRPIGDAAEPPAEQRGPMRTTGPDPWDIATNAPAQSRPSLRTVQRQVHADEHQQRIPTQQQPHRPEAKLMAMALMSAMDAAHEAEEYAAQKGWCWDFETNDIRSLGISMYIEACKQRGDSQGRRSA